MEVCTGALIDEIKNLKFIISTLRICSFSLFYPGISRQHRDAKIFFALDIRRAISTSSVSSLLYYSLSLLTKQKQSVVKTLKNLSI